MQFSTKTILALSLMSTSDVVNAHGRLTNPDASQVDGFNDHCTTTSCQRQNYGDHWYTQGSSIGCEEATGENCPFGGACCDAPIEPKTHVACWCQQFNHYDNCNLRQMSTL